MPTPATALIARGRRGFAHAARRFRRDASGATTIEYGLILAIMALSTIVSMRMFGTSLAQAFETLGDRFPRELE